MISFNVFGCCVSRDTLALLTQQKKACVLQMVSSTSTISAFSEKAERTFSMNDFKDYKGPDFYKRITVQELNKTSLDYLFEKKSDYLIVDLMNNRVKMYKKGNHYLCMDSFYRDNKERFDSEFHIDEYETVLIENLTLEDYIPGLDKLCSLILKHYSPNQIIVNRIKGSVSYAEGIRKKQFNESITNHVNYYNELIGKMYDYIIPKLRGCHVINPIENILSTNPHKWGLFHLHFHEYYYEYAAKAIELICKNLPYDEEAARLEDLRRIYWEKFELLNLKLDMTSKNDQLKWAQNAAVFEKDLLLDLFSSKRFIDNLLKIKEKNFKVAVLKAFDYSGIILLKALETYGIEVVFKTHLWNFEWLKSEDFDKCRQADLVISANVHENKYPEKDGVRAILISDLLK